MTVGGVKERAREIVDRLPDDATWEELQYEIYVRQSVEAGLRDADEGRTATIEEVRQKFEGKYHDR